MKKNTELSDTINRVIGISISVFVIGFIAIAATTWWLHSRAADDNYRLAQKRSEIFARAFAEHSRAISTMVDFALQQLVDQWSPDWSKFNAMSGLIAQRMGRISVQIAATDAKGMLATTNLQRPTVPVDLSDRQHIRVQLENPGAGLYISAPVKGRVSQKWTIQLTRAIRHMNELKGVAVISLDPFYFSAFYDSLNLSEKDMVTMVSTDGAVLAQAPLNEKAYATQIKGAPFQSANAPSNGTYTQISPIDGVERIFGYYKLEDYDLVLLVGLSKYSIQAEFEGEQRLIVTTGISITAIWLIFILWLATRHIRREAETQRLREEAGNLVTAVAHRTEELTRSLVALESSNNKAQLAYEAMNSAAEGIVVAEATRPDFPLVFSNTAFEKITGYKRDEILGKNCRFLHQDDKDQAGLAVIREALREGKGCKVLLRNFRKDGQPFMNELSIAPVLDKAGNVTHFVGIQNDVTRSHNAEAAMREMQKLEAIGQLTGGLAHDFNNLLGVVIGNLDVLGDKLPEDNKLRHAHHIALQAALRGAEVTRSLLAVARRQPMEIATTDMNALVAEMLPLIRSSAGSAVTVRTQLRLGELSVPLDAASLTNSVLNLVINARDAMRDQSTQKRIVLCTGLKQIPGENDLGLRAGTYATLEVQDNGPGMSEEVRSRAFEPFFTTKERGHGTGLGLAMVRGFAEQLGGTAQIESHSGSGTVVSIYLPQ